MYNLALIGQAVSGAKMFENVNGRTEDGQTTTDGHRIHGYPSAQVS